VTFGGRPLLGAKLPLTRHFRSCGALSTVNANRREISLLGVQIARSHGFSPKASAKSVAEFETFVSVACLRPGFADIAERTAVHDWKFAARVDALTRIEMQRLIERLWMEHRFTAVLVTHDVAEGRDHG
jgi:hypothetical protein